MQQFQSYSYGDGGDGYDPAALDGQMSFSQPPSGQPSPQTSEFYADSYFDESVASLAPAAFAVDPIDAAYGPQAMSAGSPSAYAESVDHNMHDAEVDMLQSSGLSGFDVPGGGGRSSLATYAMDPPSAAVPPRSYSYAGTSAMQTQSLYGARRDGAGAAMSNAFASTGRQASLHGHDAFARIRAGNMSIAPSEPTHPQQDQQLQQSHHYRQQQQQAQAMQMSEQQQQQRGPTQADRVRMLASMRTISSPVLSVSPGATFRSSPVRPTMQRPQSHHVAQSTMADLQHQGQVSPSPTYQPYPAYNLANPVYDLYGSSYGTEDAPIPQPAYSHNSRMVVDSKPFSRNPTEPSGPFDHKALGLPSPPRRTDSGVQTLNQHKNIYSGSGFDLVGILARVVNRRNPVIEIGAVDMSCSFVVVDARKFDQPIVYASETFARLTGYDTDEIVGKNCRSLYSAPQTMRDVLTVPFLHRPFLTSAG